MQFIIKVSRLTVAVLLTILKIAIFANYILIVDPL